MPEGYSLESVPQNVSLSNKFGTYMVTYNISPTSIQLIRLKERINNRFPASDYDELVKFYDAMFKADRAKIVFVKKEG